MRRPGAPPGAGPVRLSAAEVEQLLVLAARPGLDQQARATLLAAAPSDVVPVAEHRLREMVEGLWAVGWQPAELAWQASRRRGRAGPALAAVTEAIVAGWPRDVVVHPQWRDQLADLGIAPDGGAAVAAAGWAAAVAEPVVDALVDLAVVLQPLPAIEVLLPVPGRSDVRVVSAAAGGSVDGIDAKVLERVRALLAKAESTTFEAEAQALTAKAHELMTRHSLEHALVARRGDERSRPQVHRFCIDDPYADARSFLLAVIADASRCRAVLLGGVQMVTVVGFPSDLAAVDVLYTSLLVQAQTALDQLARGSQPGSRERSRGFRSSFLRGFSHRIGDRLADAGVTAIEEVDTSSGGALVPVLAERTEAVDREVAALHPRLRTKAASSPTDHLGWHAGQEAAERADLPWDRLGSGSP